MGQRQQQQQQTSEFHKSIDVKTAHEILNMMEKYLCEGQKRQKEALRLQELAGGAGDVIQFAERGGEVGNDSGRSEAPVP